MKNNLAKGFILLGLVCAAGAFAQNDQPRMAIVLQEMGQKPTDFHLPEMLRDRLLIQAGGEVVNTDDISLPTVPNDRYDLKRLVEWGQETGARYLIYLQIDRRAIEVRKQKSIPFLLNRYLVEGIVDGTLCLIDVSRGKAVRQWDLKTRLSGPRQWQVAENYPDDPDLQMSAPRKLEFLRRLDSQAVADIMANLGPYVRGR